MQLVIHSPYGSRINRAWGLALRKRFCRKFNFELQAAATEDNIILSLTTAHSFALADVSRYLHSATIRPLLIQAMLDAPMFVTRWRWVIGVALALPRFRGGRKVPPQLARMELPSSFLNAFTLQPGSTTITESGRQSSSAPRLRMASMRRSAWSRVMAVMGPPVAMIRCGASASAAECSSVTQRAG